MAMKPIPNRCMWCLREPLDATFKTKSHVLPKCVGNKRQQVLPLGIVCDACNNYFGVNIEDALITDPIFEARVGLLQLRDKKREFVYEHSSDGVKRDAHMEAEVSDNRINLITHYEIKGQPGKSNETRVISRFKDYDDRALALLSRAIHKIAFESLAHSLFVKNAFEVVNINLRDIDIFSNDFEAIREWVRYGQPQNVVRPVLRSQRFDEVDSQERLYQWETFIYGFQHWFRYEMNLFGDWFIVSLTSPAEKADGDLKSWVERTTFGHPVWMVGDKLQRIV